MTTNDLDSMSLYKIGKTEHEWRQTLEADRDRAKARVEDLEGRICDLLSANPYAKLTAFQGRLADAVGLLDRVVTQVGRTITSELREEIDAFLASHAQLAAMTTEQSLAISQRTRDAYVAQAEQSKAQGAQPAALDQLETMSFEYVDLSKERRKVTITRDDVIEHMEDALYEKLGDQICHCEPLGETNVVDCNCQDYIEQFTLVKPHSSMRGADRA